MPREIHVTKRQTFWLNADAGGTDTAAQSDFNERWCVCFLRHRTVLKCKKKNPWWLICTHSFISRKFSQTSLPGVFNLWFPSCDIMISARWVVEEEEKEGGGGAGGQRRGGTSSWSLEQERGRRWGESDNKRKSAAPPEVTWTPQEERRRSGAASSRVRAFKERRAGERRRRRNRAWVFSLWKSCERAGEGGAGGGGYFSRVFSPPLLSPFSFFFFGSAPHSNTERSRSGVGPGALRLSAPLVQPIGTFMMPQWEVPAPQPEPSTDTEPSPPPHAWPRVFWILDLNAPLGCDHDWMVDISWRPGRDPGGPPWDTWLVFLFWGGSVSS